MFSIYLFLYIYFYFYFLAASGLRCGMRDLPCSMQALFLLLRYAGSSLQCMGFSLVAMRGLLSSCGTWALSSSGMWVFSL